MLVRHARCQHGPWAASPSRTRPCLHRHIRRSSRCRCPDSRSWQRGLLARAYELCLRTYSAAGALLRGEAYWTSWLLGKVYLRSQKKRVTAGQIPRICPTDSLAPSYLSMLFFLPEGRVLAAEGLCGEVVQKQAYVQRARYRSSHIICHVASATVTAMPLHFPDKVFQTAVRENHYNRSIFSHSEKIMEYFLRRLG